MTRPTKFKLAAYFALLVTLFLPFSRCSHATSTSVTPGSASAGESAPPPQSAPTVAVPTTRSPWYHLFERNSPEGDYKYGMDLLIESWEVPTQMPKELDPMWLVPGRMFYVWPLATLGIALWWPPVRWRRGFHAIEIVLGLGDLFTSIMSLASPAWCDLPDATDALRLHPPPPERDRAPLDFEFPGDLLRGFSLGRAHDDARPENDLLRRRPSANPLFQTSDLGS